MALMKEKEHAGQNQERGQQAQKQLSLPKDDASSPVATGVCQTCPLEHRKAERTHEEQTGTLHQSYRKN